jgi:hypothetical protein
MPERFILVKIFFWVGDISGLALATGFFTDEVFRGGFLGAGLTADFLALGTAFLTFRNHVSSALLVIALLKRGP